MKVEDAKFLYESGLLFEVNRRVLNPLGLDLVVEVGTGETGLARCEAPQGFIVTEEILEAGLVRYRAFMREEGYRRLAARYERLGFRGQVPEDADPNADERDWTPARRELTQAARDVVEAARDVVAVLDECTDRGEELDDELGDLRVALRRLDGTSPGSTPVEGEAHVEACASEARPLWIVRVTGGRIGQADLDRINALMKESVDAARAEAARLSVGGRTVEFLPLSRPPPARLSVSGPSRRLKTTFRREFGRDAFRHRVRILKVEDLGEGEGRATVQLDNGREAILGFDVTSPVAPALVDVCVTTRDLRGGAVDVVVAGDRRIVWVGPAAPEVRKLAEGARFPEVVVHCLVGGRALCGRPGVPAEWDLSETWLAEAEFADPPPAARRCPECVVRGDLRASAERETSSLEVVVPETEESVAAEEARQAAEEEYGLPGEYLPRSPVECGRCGEVIEPFEVHVVDGRPERFCRTCFEEETS